MSLFCDEVKQSPQISKLVFVNASFQFIGFANAANLARSLDFHNPTFRCNAQLVLTRKQPYHEFDHGKSERLLTPFRTRKRFVIFVVSWTALNIQGSIYNYCLYLHTVLYNEPPWDV